MPDIETEIPRVNVINPRGEAVSIPQEQLQPALSQGYQQASPEQVDQYFKEQKFGTLGQQAITGLESAASAATFGISKGVERAAGVNPEDIEARENVNPWVSGLAKPVGIGLSSLIPGGAEIDALQEAAAAAKAGLKAGQIGEEAAAPIIQKGAEAINPFSASSVMSGLGARAAGQVGLGAPTTALAKIGSSAAQFAVENMIFQAGDENGKALLSDPDQSFESAALNIGLAGAIGAPFGAAIGAASPLWKAIGGSQTAKLLKSIVDRSNGIEGAVSDPVGQAIETSGMTLPPEVRAGLSADPQIQNIFKTLEQSDTTSSGQALQEALKNTKKQASDLLVQSLGKAPESIDSLPSKYESGKELGQALAKEFDAQTGPLAKQFEALKGKYANVDLPQGDLIPETKNIYGEVTGKPSQLPSFTDQLSDRVAQMAAQEGWTTMTDSDIMNAVKKVQANLPKLKTLDQLSKFITQVGNETYDFTNPSLSRAGMLIKNILKDGESDIILQKLGQEGPELVEQHQALRAAWKAASDVKESLDSRLKVGGGDSIGSFIKNLKEMSNENGERIVQRLSGKNDASILDLLKTNFPQTAERLKDFHIGEILKSASHRAAPGEPINSTALISQIEKMSPELKNFAIPAEAQQRISSIATLLDQFKVAPHNFSNTARTMDKLYQYLPGSVIGLATMIASHNPATAFIVGGLTKALSKDAPDAVRLALLKFLGSSQPIDSAGFKSMVDFIHAASKGNTMIAKAAKGVFQGSIGAMTGAASLDKSTAKLEKHLEALQKDPSPLYGVGGSVGHYLPDHAAAAGKFAANVVNQLNQARPATKQLSPLDKPIEPSIAEKNVYQDKLKIAQAPLSILSKVKDGSIQPSDVVSLQSLYPATYKKLNQKLHEEMINHLSDGGEISYKTRMGLSLFMGQPLDSTMTPMGIQLHQRANQQSQVQAAQEAPQAKKHLSQKGAKGLEKISSMTATRSQSLESGFSR